MLCLRWNPPKHICRPPVAYFSSFYLTLNLDTTPVDSVHSLWNVTWTGIYSGTKQQCDQLPAIGRVLHVRWLRVGSHLGPWGWLGQSHPALKASRTSPSGLSSCGSVSDLYSWTLLRGVGYCMGCSSHGPSGCVAHMGGLTWWGHQQAGSVVLWLRPDKLTQTTESCGGKGMARPLSQGDSTSEHLGHALKGRAPWPLPWLAFISFLGTLYWGWSLFTMHRFTLGCYLLQKTKERILLITSTRKDIYKCQGKSGWTGYTCP